MKNLKSKLVIALMLLGINISGIAQNEKAENIEFEGIRDLKMEKPILVYPGSPTGRTIMCMIVEIPEEGSPILYTTSDSPNLNDHVKFEF